MKINLSGFLNGIEDLIQLDGIVEESVELENQNMIYPITYNGIIFKADNMKLLDLKISYAYEEPCSRCLIPTNQKVDTRILGKLVDSKNHKEEDEEDLEYIFYDQEELDLNKYILSQVIVSLPMKVLCEDGCKGICISCGVNLNESKCDCVNEDIDPRFEKLKQFFPKN